MTMYVVDCTKTKNITAIKTQNDKMTTQQTDSNQAKSNQRTNIAQY